MKDSLFIDKARCEAIASGLNQRVQILEEYVLSVPEKNLCDDILFDVKQDIAYRGE